MKQELIFFDKKKAKLKKRLKKIDEAMEALNPNDNLFPIIAVEKEFNPSTPSLVDEIKEILNKEKKNTALSLLHHFNYVKKIQCNSNLYPVMDSSTNLTWSVEGWRTRSKLSNKLWVNDTIYPVNFWK